jgi:4,5:9,10-diseco-3-hydroxy-5,9,17-trioxoandrosta-1(10),2-diene-4-oate hydrolase
MIEQNVRVDGLNIRYLEQGTGPVLLLVHGGTLGFSVDVWRSTVEALSAKGYRVIAYDQPGFGSSDAPSDFGIKYRQDLVAKFADALSLKHSVLIGHSQGGGMVVGAALASPERYRAIVVMGTGSLLPPLATPGRDVEASDKEPTIEDTRELLKSNLFHHDLITPTLLESYHRLCVGTHFANALKRAQAGSAKSAAASPTAQKPLWQRLGEVAIPSLYIYGANDRAGAAERVGLARERFPKLTFDLLQECHHIIQWDQPEKFIALTTNFLKSLPPDV